MGMAVPPVPDEERNAPCAAFGKARCLRETLGIWLADYRHYQFTLRRPNVPEPGLLDHKQC